VTLAGWSHARSPTGRASLVPPPPWHFSADVVIVDFRCPPDRTAELMPARIDAAGDGSASVVFGAWSSSADNDPRLLEDPAHGQYNEAYIVISASMDGRKCGRVPYIWVDNELSLLRGLIQGFPKKLGAVAVSRPVAIGHGGPSRALGETFHGRVSSSGERIIEASVTLERARDDTVPSAISTPLVHARWWPSLNHEAPELDDLTRNRITDFAVANVHQGTATLSFAPARFEELDRLLPIEVTGGWVASIAFTIDGGSVIAASR
jgi:acetoacetate decarboxylase